MVQLNRLFGSWPVEEAKLWSAAEEVCFWQKARDIGKAKELETLVVDTLVSSRVEKRSTSIDGEYLPSSVWAVRGFNVDEISRSSSSQHSKPCQRFGKVYKVEIETDHRGEQNEEGFDKGRRRRQAQKGKG